MTTAPAAAVTPAAELLAGLARLVLVNETRLVTYPAGSRGDYTHPVNIVARMDGHEITRHDYGNGAEYECSCSAAPCDHVALYLANKAG